MLTYNPLRDQVDTEIDYQTGTINTEEYIGQTSDNTIGVVVPATPMVIRPKGNFGKGKMAQGNGAKITIRKAVTRQTPSDFAEVDVKISRQRQLRHVAGQKEYRGGGLLNSVDDAQQVLNAYRAGSTKILGQNKQGFPVVRFEGVTGTNINVGAGITSQATKTKGVRRT